MDMDAGSNNITDFISSTVGVLMKVCIYNVMCAWNFLSDFDRCRFIDIASKSTQIAEVLSWLIRSYI